MRPTRGIVSPLFSLESTDSTKTTSLRRELIILVVIMAVAVAMRMAFLHEVLDRDEGWYATIAQEILNGGIPYRDAIEQKPPGVFYLYTAAIALFGASVESIRIFTAIYSLLTLVSVYWLTRYLSGQAAGLIAAAIFAIFSPAPLLQGSGSNSEVFLLLPIVLSVICFVYGRDRKERSLLALSGGMVGIALMTKHVALPYMVLLLGSAFFFAPGKREWQRDISNIAVFLLPQIGLTLLVVLYFYIHGALHDFLLWTVQAPLAYINKSSTLQSSPLSEVLRDISHELLAPFLLSSVTAIGLLFRRSGPNQTLAALLLPVSIVAIIMPGKCFPHYFIQLIPFMAILGGIGLHKLAIGKRAMLWFTVPILLLLFGIYLRKDYPLFVTMPIDEVSEYKHGTDFVASVDIADHIKMRTESGDFIFQWGLEPELYFLSGRRSPVPNLASTTLGLQENRKEAILHLIKTLESKKPVYIVYQSEWANFPGDAEIRKLIERDYVLETTIGYGLVFRLK